MRKFTILLVVMVSWIGLVYSQVRTGNIYGTIVDENNQPVPGASVTLKSESTGVNLAAVTSPEGNFRFLSLSPAKDYTIRCELEGFETIVRSNIIVSVGVSTTLNFVMKLGAIDTVVEVVAATPLIDTLKPSVAANVTRDTLQELPTARDPWVILQLAPGIMVDRENIGGNESGQQSNFAGRGDSGDNAQWNIDGVNITDPAALGASPMYYDFDMFEEMQIQSAANDVSSVTGGVNINFVTRRGGDKFSGGGRFYYTSKDLQSENASEELKKRGLTGNRVNNIKDYGFNIGGPLMKSKLWFWGSVGIQDIKLENITGAPDNTTLKTYNLKLNAQLRNHRLEFYSVYANKEKEGRRRSGGYLDEIEATWNQTGPGYVFKIQDEFTVGKDLFFSAKLSRIPMSFELIPIGGIDKEVYYDLGIKKAWNTYLWYKTDRPMWYIDFLGNYFKENLLGGNHEFKFGVEYKSSVITSQTGYGNGGRVYFVSGNPYRVRLYRQWAEEYWIKRFSYFLQDTYTKGKLSLNLGLRVDRQWGGINDMKIPGTNVSWANNIGGINYNWSDSIQEAEEYNFTWNTLSPRLGLTYDIFGDGKTVARANFSIYGSIFDSSIAWQFINTSTHYFRWYDTGDKIVQGNELVWYNTIDYKGSLFDAKHVLDPDLTAEKTAELLAGVEREVAENFAIGVNFIYRKMYDYNWGKHLVCKNDETWCTSEDGINPIPDQYVQIENDDWILYYFNSYYGGYPYWDFDYDQVLFYSGYDYLTKHPDYWQDYKGLEITMKKRLSNKWMLDGSVTFQSWKVHYDSRNAYQDPTDHQPNDYLNGAEYAYQSAGSGAVDVFMNAKWMFKVGALYQFPYDIALSGTLIARQGYILPLIASDYDLEKEISGYAAPEVLIEKFGSNRLENMYLINIRVEKLFDLKEKGRIYISFDGFNLTNSAIALAKERDKNSDNYGQTLQIMSPRLFRIGLRYEF